jgi:uncharacterized protein YjdB
MKHKLCYWGALVTLVLLWLPVTAWAVDSPVGVSYRGHIQDRGDYPGDGSWIDSPEIIGTTGESKRIEGFEIKLTGAVPEAMELRYNVHVQNKGWLYDENDSTDWPRDGAYAGTRGESLRIEAVKLVLTDVDGQPLPGYSVQYRGHVQNVGDLPADTSQWLADGEQLGTVGSSQRLEALLVQVVKTGTDPVEPAETVVYDAAGSYGPDHGSDTLAGDVIVAADGVTLNNLVIQGNLTISEAVGDGTVTLNNVTVVGDTLVRGGGVNSIHINGGQYSRIVMEKTASGAVRIVATGVDGLDVVIAEDAAGETIILEGAFASVTVNAPNMIVTTQGNTTTIGTMTVGAGAAGTTLNLASGTTVTDLELNAKTAVKGQGTVVKATVKADGVVFDKKPGTYTVAPGVVIPPVFPSDSGGGSGPTTIAVSAVSLDKTAIALAINVTDSLTATVVPATATNKTLTWSSSDNAIATVDSNGTVTAVSEGEATITVTSQDGNKSATCTVAVKDLKQTIAGVTVPFAGETPVTAITATSQFSGTVSWQKNDGSGWTALATGEKFDGTSTYRATIALTINAPYLPADIPANFFGVAGATATNEAGSLVVTAEFLPTNAFKIDNNGWITAFSGPGGPVAVPAQVNNITVTGIGQEAFENQAAITAITLPTTVKTIEYEAFFGCSGLTAVTLTAPAELQTIGPSAFDGCTALTGIAIPDPVKSIGLGAFNGCTKLATVTISANSQLESIGGNAFFCCTALTTINIPQQVISLGGGAFQHCGALDTVTIAGNLTAIESDTFLDCRALTAITLPESVESIGYGAFSFCRKLTSIAIPQKVTALGAYAFDNCEMLETVTFSGTPTLKTIDEKAFKGCTKLINIEIPMTVTALGDYAFENCPVLSTITFRGPTPTLGSEAIAAGTTIRHYANYSGYDGWTGYTKELILAAPTQTALQIANSGSPSVTVNWSTVANATGYDVFVREAAGTYGTAIASVAGGVTTAEITGLDSSKNCYFIVKARDAYGQSLPSNEQFTDFSIAVTGVSLTPQPLNLVYGDIRTLTATVAPANATNPGITWTSSDPSVATVDQSGTVTAVYAGTATITASSQADNTITATTAVTVQGRLSCYDSRAVAGIDDNNYVALSLAGDTFKSGSSFVFDAGTTDLLLGSPTSSTNNYTFSLINTPKPGTLTLQATGLTSGVNSTTVSVTILEPVMTFANTDFDDTTASFSWPALNGASAVSLQQQKNGDANWTTATCDITPASTATTVTGLEPGTVYQFRLLVTGGATPGVSNSVTVTPLFEATGPGTEMTITKYNGNDQNVVIPATINNIPVTSIGAGAFSGKTNLKTVSIPDSVTSIGAGAFLDCTQLTTLSFAGSSELTAIGDEAFQGCKNLQSVAIPGNVASIGESAFLQCLAMTSLDLGNVASIGTNAFNQCNALTNLTIPNTVKQIDAQAFARCAGLKTVTFAGGTTAQSISGAIFSECTNLETVTFEATSKITTMNWANFSGCSKLTSVTLPPNLTVIPNNTFQNCAALASMTIPATVTSIGGNAFSGCKANSGTGQSELVLRFYGDAPINDASAIPAGTTIEYLTGRINFDLARFPNCNIVTFTP